MDSENNGQLSCPFLVRLRNIHQRNGEPLSFQADFFVFALFCSLACESNELVADKIATMKSSLKFLPGRLFMAKNIVNKFKKISSNSNNLHCLIQFACIK
jgi:hypothetical protein